MYWDNVQFLQRNPNDTCPVGAFNMEFYNHGMLYYTFM